VATFPGSGSNALGVKVELLLNSVWTDITQYVMLRNLIQIAGMGRADWTSTLQAATLTLSLRNDGRFTPKLAGGAYFPNITRNTQIRVSVNATSVTAVAYSGFRFWGEVAEWPPAWNVAGRDVHVDITASGIWRRMSQLQTTLGSAFTRYNSLTLTGTSAPRSYWPMEDGTGSGALVSYDSVAGTANAVQSFVAGQPGLSLAACTDFKGSDGIPQLNAATITATVPAGGTATNNVTRFLISVPAAGDSASGTTNWNLAEVNSAGTIAKFEVYLNFAGTLLMQLRNSGGTVVASGTTTTNVKGKPVLASCELTPSGGNVAFAFRIIIPGAAGITESLTGTVTTASVGAVSTVKFGRAGVLMDTAVGHLSVTYGAVPLMVPAAYALGGYAGELALDRFTRICGEMGITAETIGTAASTAAMGPQVDDTLTAVLQSIEDTDMGLLFESRTQFGLGYRTLASMANQAAAATISYTAGILDPSLAPAYDDQLTRNNVTVTNQSTGYTQQAILTVGAMSVLNPPSGIGNGYAYARTVNASLDSQIAGIATWLLNLGGVDEVRFPVITIRLAKPAAAGLFAALPGLRPGDYLQITNPPAFLTATTVKQLAWGYTETIGVNQWDLAFNAVPESPYETGFSPGTVQTAQLPGSGAVTSTAPGAGGLGGIIMNGSITPGMLSEGITVKTLGGTRTTISASAPANPDTGDIWIASATGLISQWDGAAWQPYKLDGAAGIQAGTIVAANIAASTLTSSLIAAGQVYAGFVDATTITGAQFVAAGAAGQILIYSGTPALGNLAGSDSAANYTDSFGNLALAGRTSYTLIGGTYFATSVRDGSIIVSTASSAGGPYTNQSSLIGSTAGRMMLQTPAGYAAPLSSSQADNTPHTCSTAGFTQLSKAWTIPANDAQVGTLYRVTAWGDGQFGSTLQQMSTNLSGGNAQANTPTSAQTASANVFFRAEGSLLIGVTGSSGSGTFNLVVHTSSGGSNGYSALGDSTAVAYDTTISNTLGLFTKWAATTGAPTITCRGSLFERLGN
jgi:hypothetical protein